MTMTATATGLPRSRPLTAADLEHMPDDGHRYELIDGSLIVTPSPSVPHQGAVVQLVGMLLNRCPPDLRIFVAPLDVQYSEHTVLQPDILVMRRDEVSGLKLTTGPVLAIEMLSPSTRLIDLSLKRATYEREGAASYWVVDPLAPSVTIWELDEGRYAERLRATADEPVVVDLPFPITFRPSDLTR